MNFWKEILIQYVLILCIYNILAYTNNTGSPDGYIVVVSMMGLYMILLYAWTSSVNKTNKSLLNKALIKFILPLLFGNYMFLCAIFPFDLSSFYLSLMYYIPGSVSLIINLYIAQRPQNNKKQKTS